MLGVLEREAETESADGEGYVNYLSACSGIEAATVAWHPLGWTPAAFSEVEKFPCNVLKHHYSHVPNWGDMTKFKEWPDANVDIFVGGTPCQSFSIAGLRKGLDDPRGNLMLTYLAIAQRYKPRWIVWENVPGVLSSNGGRDFGTFLAGLAQCGYGFAYRVLDAQFVRTLSHNRAVPQRRRRVFVIGHFGNWQRAAAVLFDSESLRGNPPPRRKAGEKITSTVSGGAPFSRTGNERVETDAMIVMATGQGGAEITSNHAPTLNCNHEQPIVCIGMDDQMNAAPELMGTLLSRTNSGGSRMCVAISGNVVDRKPENGGNGAGADESGAMYTLAKVDSHAVVIPINTQIAMRHNSLGDGTGLGIGQDGDPAFTILKNHHHVVAYGINEHPHVGHCLRAGASKADKHESTTCIQQQMQVRRLTPLECERLQGFPDGYTAIPKASDSARYKALGNSMAVNVMRVIGDRIKMVEEISEGRTCNAS